jgi:hypothetical protein
MTTNPPGVDQHWFGRLATARSPSMSAVQLSEAMDSLGTANLPKRQRDVAIARETDIFLEVSFRRLASQAGSGAEQPMDLGPRTEPK